MSAVQRPSGVRYLSRISAGSSSGQGIRAIGEVPVADSGSDNGQANALNGTIRPSSASTPRRSSLSSGTSRQSCPMRSRLRLSAQLVVMNSVCPPPDFWDTACLPAAPNVEYPRRQGAGRELAGAGRSWKTEGLSAMYTLQIEHAIKDFGMWKAAFDRIR